MGARVFTPTEAAADGASILARLASRRTLSDSLSLSMVLITKRVLPSPLSLMNSLAISQSISLLENTSQEDQENRPNKSNTTLG